MTNYIYHNNKESHEDLELVSSPVWQRYEGVTQDDYYKGKLFYEDDIEDGKYNIDQAVIEQVLDKYSMFGDYSEPVLKELKKAGLYEGNIEPTNSEVIPLVVTAIIGEIYYNIFMS